MGVTILPDEKVVLGQRNDGGSGLTSADGDLSHLATDSAGRVGITDLGGSITTDVGDGSNVALGATSDADTATTAIGLLKKIKSLLSGSLSIGGTVATSVADGANIIEGSSADTSSSKSIYGSLLKLISLLPTALVGGRLDVNIGATAVAQPVTDNSGSLTVDGTVTANAGTGPWPVTDNSGSLTVDGTVTANPSTPTATTGNIVSNSTSITSALNGASSVGVQVSGTYSGVQFTFKASVDGGANYVAVVAQRMTGSTTFTQETASGSLSANTVRQWIIDTTGFTHFQVLATAFTSGSAAVVIQPHPGPRSNIVGANILSGSVGVTGTAAISGTVTATQATAANLLTQVSQPTAADLNATIVQPDSTLLNANVYSADGSAFHVTVDNSESLRPSFGVGIAGLVAPSSATDIFEIRGNTGTTIRLTRIRISGIATAAVAIDILLIKRSTHDSGGTSTSPTPVQMDSGAGAVVGSINAYTANPTLGTAVGTVGAQRLTLSPATSAIPIVTAEWTFGTREAAPLKIYDGESLAVNLNGATISGNSFDIDVEWTEA